MPLRRLLLHILRLLLIISTLLHSHTSTHHARLSIMLLRLSLPIVSTLRRILRARLRRPSTSGQLREQTPLLRWLLVGHAPASRVRRTAGVHAASAAGSAVVIVCGAARRRTGWVCGTCGTCTSVFFSLEAARKGGVGGGVRTVIVVGLFWAEVGDGWVAAAGTAAGVVGGRRTGGGVAVGAAWGVDGLGGTFPGGLLGVDLKVGRGVLVCASSTRSKWRFGWHCNGLLLVRARRRLEGRWECCSWR